jgi:hypothetical protein
MSAPSYTIFDSDTGTTILKWAITILVAGFIAQFGKKLATFLIEKAKRVKTRRSSERSARPAAGSPPLTGQDNGVSGTVSPGSDTRTGNLKFNKKLLKTMSKERKKK